MSIEKIRNTVSALMSGRRKVYIAIVASMLVFCLLTSFVVMRINTVTVLEGGKEVASFTTFASDKDQLLATAGVEVAASDIVHQTRDGRNIKIEVTRAFNVSIKTADQEITERLDFSDAVILLEEEETQRRETNARLRKQRQQERELRRIEEEKERVRLAEEEERARKAAEEEERRAQEAQRKHDMERLTPVVEQLERFRILRTDQLQERREREARRRAEQARRLETQRKQL